MKTLIFYHREDRYQVNEKGQIKCNGLTHFSPNWIFLGGSSHHWHTHVTVTLEDAFQHPEKLNGCLGWDKDHGTTRQWAGRYCGRVPRIHGAYIQDKQ